MWILRSNLIFNLETHRGHWLNVNLVYRTCHRKLHLKYNSNSKELFENEKNQQSKHEGLRYSCNQCEYQATLQVNLKSHEQSKHGGVKYSCKQCKHQVTRQDQLNTHQQSKHGSVKCSCNQCEYQATTE